MCLLWWRSTIPPLPTWCFHTDLPAPPPPPVITNVTPNYSKASTNYTNYCNNLIGKIPFYYKVRESQVRLYNNFPQNTVFAWPEETMICSVGKSERGLSVLFDFVMALTSAAQLMFWVLQFFCSLWFCIFWESISRRIDAVLAPERRLIKILNEKGIILKAVNLFFTAP